MKANSTPVRLSNEANAQLDTLTKRFGVSKKRLAEQAIHEAAQRWPETGLNIPAILVSPRLSRQGRAA
jgi:predicted transcriptional regulator